MKIPGSSRYQNVQIFLTDPFYLYNEYKIWVNMIRTKTESQEIIWTEESVFQVNNQVLCCQVFNFMSKTAIKTLE